MKESCMNVHVRHHQSCFHVSTTFIVWWAASLGELNNPFWQLAVLNSTVHVHLSSLSQIDKSVLMWSQFKRTMCAIFKMVILDLRQLVFIKNSLLVWVPASRYLAKYSFQEMEGKSVFTEEQGLLQYSVFTFYQNLCANRYCMILLRILVLHLHTYIMRCSNSEIWNSSEVTEDFLKKWCSHVWFCWKKSVKII